MNESILAVGIGLLVAGVVVALATNSYLDTPDQEKKKQRDVSGGDGSFAYFDAGGSGSDCSCDAGGCDGGGGCD